MNDIVVVPRHQPTNDARRPYIVLPTLHTSQNAAYWTKGRFLAVRCGRRWGKTALGEVIACDGATKGQNIGIFAPDYKILAETYTEIAEILAPIRVASSKVEGVFRTITGGRVDYWSLDNERAGRSRKYHKVIIDEGAFTKPNMMRIWETAIKPSLLDYQGSAIVLSTPNGADPENFFWRICNQPEHEFVEYHAPTHLNPHIPERIPGEDEESYLARRAEEFDKIKKNNHPLVYQQEYLAQFVDWSGIKFFNVQDCLVGGQPVDYPAHCDCVIAILDTAVKSGSEHDGTAVSYYALINDGLDYKVVVLDWDIVQIEGSLLEVWIPNVFRRLEELSRACKARMNLGVHIEDKVSGSILINQAQRRGMNAYAIDSKLTAMGKDERAIDVSGYVFQKKAKLSRFAHEKVSVYKNTSRNHFMSQVFNYRLGVKNQADDMLDTFCYALALLLGDGEGL